MLGLGIARKIGLGKLARKLIIAKAKRQHLQFLKKNKKLVKQRNKQKVFVIGFNKTGTTSIGYALEQFGFIVGKQIHGELLFDNWLNNDFEPIIEYCKTAEVFQDAPFSFPNTFEQMDKAFPNSLFILTIRDDSEQWYQSITSFHGKMWSNGNVPPTTNDLKEANYIYKGFPLYSITKLFKTTENDPYNKSKLITSYNQHITKVCDYFKDSPEQLLVVNVANPNDFQKLCDFVNIASDLKKFPHISSNDIVNENYKCEFLKP